MDISSSIEWHSNGRTAQQQPHLPRVGDGKPSGASCIGINLLALLLLIPLGTAVHADGPERVRIMTFNLWHGGDAGRQPLDATIAVITAAQADIVGLQETAGEAPKGQPRPDRAIEITQRLGWNYVDQGDGKAVISRFPLGKTTPNRQGVAMTLRSGQMIYVFNVHFAASPYQPYQLLKIPYGDGIFISTEAEAIREARAARGQQVAALLWDVRAVQDDGYPMFLTGDFNEPSHLDWTEAVARDNLCPLKVHWPSTSAVQAVGFRDAYRADHPDPLTDRGITWTSTTSLWDPSDRHERIDFVFSRPGKTVSVGVVDSQVLGESARSADVVVKPYPSDHRAVVADVVISAPAENEPEAKRRP